MNKKIVRKKYILCMGIIILICISFCCSCSPLKSSSMGNQENNDVLSKDETSFLYMGIMTVICDLEFKSGRLSELVDELSSPAPTILAALGSKEGEHPFYDAIDKMRTEMIDRLGKDFEFAIKNIHLKMTYPRQSVPNGIEEGTFKVESILILKESDFTEEEIKDSEWAMEKLEPYFTLERKRDDISTAHANIEYIVEAWSEDNQVKRKMTKKIQIEFTESETKGIEGTPGISKVDFKIVDF